MLSLKEMLGSQTSRGHSGCTFVLFQVRKQAKDQASTLFLHKKAPQLLEPFVFQTVQQIPGVGKTKALLLLEHFGSLHQLCNASVQELELVVGHMLAQQIHMFFTQTK